MLNAKLPLNLKKIISILSLVAIDVLSLIVVLVLSYETLDLFFYIKADTYPFLNYKQVSFWWIIGVFISFIFYEKLYTRRLPVWDGIKEMLKAITGSTILILAIVSLTNTGNRFHPAAVFMMYLYGLILIPLFRIYGKRVLYKYNIWKERVIILGAGQSGCAIAKGISENRHLGYEIVGFLDDDVNKIGKNITIGNQHYRVIGSLKHYRRIIKNLDVPTVIVSMPSLDIDKLSRITNDVQKHAKNILLVPELKGVCLTNTELYHLFNQKIFMLNIKNNLKSKWNQLLKFLFDYFVSFLLVPLVFPLIAVLGILIKLDSPGPVFFSHTRIGKNGKPIKVYKFRTMYRDSKERLEKILREDPAARDEWETYFKLKNDPRITRIGSFLRKSSLDELAQIFNVLKGEMSLVGPRPVVKDEIVKYYKEDKEFYVLTKPGITGLWQVSGRNEIDYEDRVKLDTWYVLNWSIWFDIVILLKTIKVVLAREGAY